MFVQITDKKSPAEPAARRVYVITAAILFGTCSATFP